MNSKIRGSGLGIAGALLTLLVGSVQAEGPAIGGYVDAQYNYNFDKPMSGATALRSYDAQDNNIANSAHLAITGKLSDEVTYVVEVDAGSDADTTAVTMTGGATPVASGQDVVLQEAYLNYAGPNRLGFKAGKFATYQGIEVIESVANPTISRGFLFGLAEPFLHVGAVATYAMEKVDFAAGVVNGWDQQNDANTGKTAVGKVGFNFGDPLAFAISGYHGPEQTGNVSNNRSSVDLTGVTKIIPNVDLWFQGNWGTESAVLDRDGDGTADDRGDWKGFAIEPVVNVTDRFFVGGRFEYFDDDGSRTGTMDAVVRNVTIAPGYKITDNVVIRGEVRMDESNRKVFQDDKGAAEDKTTTGAVQLYVTF